VKQVTKAATLTLLVIATVAVLVNQGFSQDDGDSLPRGKWAIGAHPYAGPMYYSQPVKVIGVISDTAKGFQVTTVGLKNTSSRMVSAVKLTWYISSEQTGDAVLLQGATELLTLKGGLPVGKSEYVEVPVVSLGSVCKPLLKNGTLQGRYSIEVAVTEILYDDGSSWRGDPKNMNTAHKSGLRPGPVPEGCPHQVCEYSHELLAYRCVSGLTQMCTNCGTHCISSMCGEWTPGC